MKIITLPSILNTEEKLRKKNWKKWRRNYLLNILRRIEKKNEQKPVIGFKVISIQISENLKIVFRFWDSPKF